MKQKKGDILDMMSLVIVLFLLIVGFFVISFTIPYITSGLKVAGLNNSAEGINAINKLDDFANTGIQKGVFFVFIGLCISVLISSFFADTHPIWLGLYIFFLIMTVILAGYLANTYETMIGLNNFNGWTQSYMTTIMQHIVLITVIVACASFIIMFGKGVIGGGGNNQF